jgi:hypothetical protein
LFITKFKNNLTHKKKNKLYLNNIINEILK